MDPLTALSAAGTIVQFVEFGSKLLASTVHLYKSSPGSLKVHEELELATADLQSVIAKLRGTSFALPTEDHGTLTETEKQDQDNFRQMCDEATSIADELIARLRSLKVNLGKHHAWESLKAAVRSIWSKEEILSLQARLATLKESLQSRSLFSIQDKLDATFYKLSSRFDNLDTQTQQIVEALGNANQSMSREIANALATLICRSESINDDAHLRTRQMIADLRSSMPLGPDPVKVVTAQVEMLNVESPEERVRRGAVNKNILQELSYPGMTNRYEEILEAHPKTFDWIFSNVEHSGSPWSDFGRWLQEDSGIYWINGKPGSGKSTLMKHIYDDPTTTHFLQKWMTSDLSTSFQSCVATFFFWNSGTKIQQSQQGLLRSLLFQILANHPTLIPIVFPTRWAELYGSTSADMTQQFVPKTWSLRQLHTTREALMDQKQYPLKICFLIDGLDEFSGDTEQLCLFLKRLSERSESAKFCLSSRSCVQFQHNFARCANLRLQDLTSNDITTYVNDKLHSSPSFIALSVRHAELASALANEIVERAEGVFLWVEIVVRLLLKGVNNSDTVAQLWTRLISFPREIYPLYDTILSSIEPLYLEWSSRVFQIMRLSTKLSSDPFQKIDPSRRSNKSNKQELIADDGVSGLTLMQLVLALSDQNSFCALEMAVAPELAEMCEETQRQLTVRCAGLLEVAYTEQRDSHDGEDIHRPGPPGRLIRWMHRTARDFVDQNPRWEKEWSLPGFSASSAMMKSCILCCSNKHAQRLHFRWFQSTQREALIYAHHANGDRASRKFRTHLLVKLMKTLDSSMSVESYKRSESLSEVEKYLHRATMFCLSDFVEDMLSFKPPTVQIHVAGLLIRRLCGNVITSSPGFPFPTVEVVTSLIKMGRPAPRRGPGSTQTVDAEIWPGIGKMYPIYTTNKMNALVVPRFVDSQLSIIDTFLNHNVDSTGSLKNIPHDFVLPKKKLQDEAEEKYKYIECEFGVLSIIQTLQEALGIEVRNQKEAREISGSKRKRSGRPHAAPVILNSDGSDSDDVIFLEERPVNREKRVKIGEMTEV